MSRNEEKSAVNSEVLREALRARLRKRYAGKAGSVPEEYTTSWYAVGCRHRGWLPAP
jgi:hypothetical protein